MGKLKIAVTGPNGQLGSELVRQGGIALGGRFGSLIFHLEDELLDIAPDIVVNCAAYTQVDEAEKRKKAAIDVNTFGVLELSRVFDSYLIQISTDYVFDGRAGPYCPKDAPNPISFYGLSKLGGELVTRRHKGPWLIIRTTVLFSRSDNNFAAKVVKQLANGEQVKLFQPDLIGTPTYVPALAKEIIRLAQEGYTGVAHVAGNRTMSRLEFAKMIAAAFGFDPDDIMPTDTPPAPDLAPRPPIAGLICDHDGRRPIYSHDIQGGLAELADMYQRGAIWKGG